MSNQIYFCGYRAEHFRNSSNSGIATYSGVQDTNDYNSYSLGTLHFSDKGFAYFVDPGSFSSIYFVFQSYTFGGNSAQMNLCDGANYIKITTVDNGNYGIYSTTYQGTYDKTTNTESNQTTTNTSSTYRKLQYNCRIYGKLYSTTGTSYNKIYYQITQVDPSGNIIINGSVDITLTTPLSTLEYSYVSGGGYISYLILSNFDMTGSYLDYTTYSNKGITSQWSGNTSTFSTYPVSYSSSGGILGTTNNTSQSYTLSKVLNCGNTATNIPVCMINSSNNISTRSNVIPYTNGYTGTYDITIPNYLEPGTGISIVFYVDSGISNYQIVFQNNGSSVFPVFDINEQSGNYNPKSAMYSQWGLNQTFSYIGSVINYNSWNTMELFCDSSGILTLYVNSLAGNQITNASTSTTYSLLASAYVVIASIAYIKSPSVSYPFDKDSNVVSYVDFADPNNPVIHGDTTQLSITSKSLTASTPLANIPNIEITTNTEYDVNISPYVINGDNAITTTDISSVSSSGSTSTFYMYDNPITKSSWTTDDIKNSQFGLTKIS